MGDAAMPLEYKKAQFLTGYRFFHHPENPTLGILRLDTKGEPQWVLVSKEGLLELAAACTRHAEELQKVQ